MSVRSIVIAKDRQGTQHFYSWRFHGHQHHRLLSISHGRWIRLAHENDQFASLIASAARPPLASVNDVVITIPTNRTLDICSIAGCHGRFSHGKTRPDRSVKKRQKPKA